MARLIFGMNQSLDGYVDHQAFGPSPRLFEHFIEQTRRQSGCIYGRKLYEIMAYWDEDQADWGEAETAFARAWRDQHKWVASRTLKSVGPNATLIDGDFAEAVLAIKAREPGEIEVGGPDLARSLAQAGLIDEYRIYLHPVVVGGGALFFKGHQPRLRLVGSEPVDGEVLKLTYAPL